MELGDPELVILDEPANGLDLGGVHWLRTFIRGFADKGGTVLIASHMLGLPAESLGRRSDQLAVLGQGQRLGTLLLPCSARFRCRSSFARALSGRPSSLRRDAAVS